MTPVFFTDRDRGKRFAETLRSAGLTVERHADHFLPDCPDDAWLSEIGRRRWIAITHDARIRYKPNELQAVVQHRVALLVVIGKVPLPLLAASFVATLPRIEAFVGHHEPPYIARVYRAPIGLGRIELWFPPARS